MAIIWPFSRRVVFRAEMGQVSPMSYSLLRAAVVLALPVLALACHRHRQEAPPPAYAPPPPVAAAPPPACDPLGSWKVAGAAGSDQIEIGRGDNPNQFVIKQKGMTNGVGVGTYESSKLKVDMAGATGGLYHCTMADDCNSMTCGFNGGANPTVFTKQQPTTIGM